MDSSEYGTNKQWHLVIHCHRVISLKFCICTQSNLHIIGDIEHFTIFKVFN